MDYWNTQNEQSLSAATSNRQASRPQAFERESSAHAEAPLLTGPIGIPPVVTGPITTGPAPMPLQFPLNPTQYPAYYQVPMTVPYPMVRAFDPNGNEVVYEARFFPPVVYPRPFFYPPRPFFPPVYPPFFW